jgi:hypothetical protein
VQNRYVADVGDFGKYGLLRALLTDSSLSLAVIWYLVQNETHTNDGRHTAYLRTEPTGIYGRCDPELFHGLRRVLSKGRDVGVVERSGILPARTSFHSAPLTFHVAESPTERRAKREHWLADAISIAGAADIAFLDPDNGLECKVPQHSRNGPKYVYYGDVRAIGAMRKSLVIYHHLARQGTALQQVQRRAHELSKHLPAEYKLAALRFRRGSARVFFIASAPHHRELDIRVRAFGKTDWAQHFANDSITRCG